MGKCDICRKESGEYQLCPDCFQEMQQGKLDHCKNCGKWYRKGKICSCVKASPNNPATTVVAQSNTQTTYQEKEGPSGCLIALIIIIAMAIVIGLGIMFATEPWEDTDDDETSAFTEMTKQKPTLTADQSSLGTAVDIQIKANDNYKEVIVELLLYDENDNIISQQYLTQTNLTKGNTYIVTYNLSLSELTKVDSYSYKVYKYK
ncbi:MAG: hypothetical protein E7585_01875 [Ruminococcaceae bacterium]|nr:hypothetical protein [Oscillospiraceae bacterium]